MNSCRCTNLLLALACAPALLAGDWFPLETGNQWIYRGSGTRKTEPLVVRVGESRDVGGHTYFRLDGLTGGPYWVRNDGDRVLEWKEDTSEEALWYDFSKNVGESYPTGAPNAPHTATITNRDTTVTGPAGTFPAGVTISYGDVRSGDFGGSIITAEVFVQGVGLVTRDLSMAGGTSAKYELVYARLGSATVISGQENGVELSLNEDKSWARFRVGTAQGASHTLRLYDETGSETWTWTNASPWFSFVGDANVQLPAMRPGRYVLIAEYGTARVSLPFTVQ